MRRRLHGASRILLPMFAAVLLVSALAWDRRCSRPDRIKLGMEIERLQHLHDAMLRFTLDREREPDALSELVPGYISESMLCFQPDGRNAPRLPILWDAGSRVLSWSEPFTIRGLFPRKAIIAVTVPKYVVNRDGVTGQNVFRQSGPTVALDPEDIIIEAELFQYLSYGWEIAERDGASGQGYIHLKEGVGDIAVTGREFDPEVRSGDFYNVSGSRDRIEARCYFEAPADGTYHLAVRTMAQRSQCSNIIKVRIGASEFDVGHNGSAPFVWLWHSPGSVHLDKGRHAISFLTYQDGVKVDQAVLSRQRRSPGSDGIFSGGYTQAAELPPGHSPLTLSLSVDSLVVSNEKTPVVDAYIRKPDRSEVRAMLQISMDLPTGRVRDRTLDITLPAETLLAKIPCEVDLPRPLDKREYLLRCRLLEGAEVIQERTLVLYHGFDWSILGPLPYMSPDARAEPEMSPELAAAYEFAGQTFTWQKYCHALSDHFGIMDFGKMYSERTYDAMPNVSLYAYTEIDVAERGDYLLKVQGDDHIVVWINGTYVAMTGGGHMETAIRSSAHFTTSLNAGRNRILFRLNQVTGQWQAGFRIRTVQDTVADIIGVPFGRQSARLHGDEVDVPSDSEWVKTR